MMIVITIVIVEVVCAKEIKLNVTIYTITIVSEI